tara:strand:- start:141 stop:404 length:264 start_codon:yes stop_codon:yes gene_type:complete
MTSTTPKFETHEEWILSKIEDPDSPWTKFITEEQHKNWILESVRINDLRYYDGDPKSGELISKEDFDKLHDLNDMKVGFINSKCRIH